MNAVIQRQLDIENPPTEACLLADGTQSLCEIEYNGPDLDELREEASRLALIEREFLNLDANIQAAQTRLNDRNDSIRDARAALQSVENERENQLILDEVATEETSRIAGFLTGALLFAVPAALAVILAFTIYDLLRRKPEIEDPYAGQSFESAGSLTSGDAQRALPEARITPLTVVDEDGDFDDDEYEYYDEDEFDVLVESDDDGDLYNDEPFEDDDDPQPPKRSKGSRWGRDADGKAS